MKRPFILVALLLTTLVLMPDVSEAQRRNRYSKYKKRKPNKRISKYRGSGRRASGRFRPYTFVGGSLNAGNYFGDLAPVNRAASTDISFTRPGVGFFIGRKINPWVSARANVNWVRVSASDFSSDPNGPDSDPARYARNLSFRNDIIEGAIGVEIDVLKNSGSSSSRVAFTPYFYLGIGAFYHNPKGQVPAFDTHSPDYNPNDPLSTPESARFSNAGDWVALQPLGTEGQNIDGSGVEPYSLFQINIPLGVGFRMRLPGNFDASVELGARYLFTDYLDDVSGTYVDIASFDDPLTRAFVDRSLEHIDVISGAARDMNRVDEIAGSIFVADGIRRRPSFGLTGDIRGNSNDNDLYFVTQIKLSYILGGIKKKAKFR